MRDSLMGSAPASCDRESSQPKCSPLVVQASLLTMHQRHAPRAELEGGSVENGVPAFRCSIGVKVDPRRRASGESSLRPKSNRT